MHYAKPARSLLIRMQEADGQALAEYGLILALVFVAALASLALLGGAVSTSFSTFLDAAGFGS